MTRVQFVKSARKPAGSCGRCHVEIQPGMGYYWIAFFRGPKHVRCEKPECRFRKSETVQSKLSEVYAAQEAAEEALKSWDRKDHEALQDIVTTCGCGCCVFVYRASLVKALRAHHGDALICRVACDGTPGAADKEQLEQMLAEDSN